ncbi:MAG: hypothetical protein A2V93_01445 [Ignavibacteria bacterium RBG_16_34_14]|nr:MAG: hypothetical protein A2V93_01445 [Ignavibacteria bacterium RBG_16_34_14]
MKFSALILFIFFTNIYPQQAVDYFPQQLGYKWNYRISILDSNNNIIPEMTLYRIDSSAFLDEYNGMEAYHILSKLGTQETVQFLPYTDTNYVHLTGSNGYEYYKITEIEFLLSVIDSSTLNNIIPFLGLYESLSGWHLNYRFAQNLNSQYPIANYDTTVAIDTIEIPLRFIKNGKRLQDENVESEIGTFLCKKFLITSSLNYLIIPPPPFPPIPIPFITLRDTVWIAPGNWIVKDVIPSTNIDFTFLNLGEYTIPGLKREITSPITGIEENTEERFSFNLEQNYPNPFNPSTNIKFRILNFGLVSLKVYDVLGVEVATLINEEKPAGVYEITFNASKLASGVYFYKLTTSEFQETKQMLLLK